MIYECSIILNKMEVADNIFDDGMKGLHKRMDEIFRLLKARNRLNGETILDNQDLCLLLNLSKRTLRRYRATGILPYFQISGKPFYYESDVEEFIKRNQEDNTLSSEEE